MTALGSDDNNRENGKPAEDLDPSIVLFKSLEARVVNLEGAANKTTFKKLTESASASALLLGLILSFVSLHEAFVTKPQTDRIARLSQFNQAVNSAAKLRQELAQAQAQTADPKLQLVLASAATPQILNDISTARAMLRNLDNADVGIPQLIILINEGFQTGDLDSVKSFVARAVSKAEVSPYLRSEAKRYEGKYLFFTGEPHKGRQSFKEAIEHLGTSPGGAAARAYVLGDLVIAEYAFGDCGIAAADLQSFQDLLKAPQITAEARLQMATTVRSQLEPFQGHRCPAVVGLDNLASK